jgi:hypothetical protein
MPPFRINVCPMADVCFQADGTSLVEARHRMDAAESGTGPYRHAGQLRTS